MAVFSTTHRWQQALRCAAFVCLTASCATLQVPITLPTYDQDELLAASRDGVEVRVRPVIEKEEYLDLFDDYLPQIGMVALWVEVHNRRDTAVEISSSRWRLSVAEENYPALAVSNIFQEYYSRRGIRMYTLRTDATARREMERIVLRSGTLPPSGQRHGWLFFRFDASLAANWPRAARLVAADIRLDRRSTTRIEIPLTHARP